MRYRWVDSQVYPRDITWMPAGPDDDGDDDGDDDDDDG